MTTAITHELTAPAVQAAPTPWDRFAWLLLRPTWAPSVTQEVYADEARAAGQQVRAWAISAGIVVGPLVVLLALSTLR
jgi:hypothetical protein